MFSAGSALRLYNQNLVQLQLEFGQFLELSIEGDSEEMVRNELDGDKKASYVMWNASETI
jgi:hypothetical protein